MFGKALVLLAAAQISIPLGHPRRIEQPLAPIEVAGKAWFAQCTGSEDWERPAPPVRIHGNTFLVGTCGISSILITDPAGHILIDGGTQADADLIAANVRNLGFRLTDVKFILTSHEHFDHVGGIAQLQKLSGATLVTSAPAAKVFATGAAGVGDPQAGMHPPFPAAAVGRIVGDGDQVRLGGIMVEAMTTPGHTPGALSWRWMSCDGGVCRMIVYADSLTPVSSDNYRFMDHPDYVATFRSSIAKVAASPCDILLTPHPSASDMPARLNGSSPIFDPGACAAYAAKLTANLDARLAKEQAAKK